MNSDWASENLQVIRTLMERSVMYRRALSPMTLLAGVAGIVAAGLGWGLKFDQAPAFVGFWMTVACLSIIGALLVVRRQAMKDNETFWSPPTRRVVGAMTPSLLAGAILTGAVTYRWSHDNQVIPWLVPIWMLFYGTALNAAGYFMPRGIKLFGGLFILAALLLLTVFWPVLDGQDLRSAHLVMGVAFGGMHLAYGTYLHFTEKRGNAS